MYPRG